MVSNSNIELFLQLTDALVTNGQPSMQFSYSMMLNTDQGLKGDLRLGAQSNLEFITLKERLHIYSPAVTLIYLSIYEETKGADADVSSLKNYYFGEICEGRIRSTGADMEDNHTAWGGVSLPKDVRYFDMDELLLRLKIKIELW